MALAPLSVSAQAQYRFNHWTTDDGLPQNSVRAILQTRDGYLWFTTLDGMVRFDGIRFTVFNKGNTKGIQSNRFFALLEDREGSLWMGTEDGGVCRYHRGTFTSYTTSDGLTSNDVLSIHLNREGAMLVYTFNGVARWTGDRFALYVPRPGEPKGGFIRDAEDGAVWSADDEGLHQFKDGARIDFKLPDNGEPTALYMDRSGRLWVGTVGGRLFSFKDG
ncbi:MAG: ligand-binding sensor domain-containing protein, partial [Blastocatellia bacterium]